MDFSYNYRHDFSKLVERIEVQAEYENTRADLASGGTGSEGGDIMAISPGNKSRKGVAWEVRASFPLDPSQTLVEHRSPQNNINFGRQTTGSSPLSSTAGTDGSSSASEKPRPLTPEPTAEVAADTDFIANDTDPVRSNRSGNESPASEPKWSTVAKKRRGKRISPVMTSTAVPSVARENDDAKSVAVQEAAEDKDHREESDILEAMEAWVDAKAEQEEVLWEVWNAECELSSPVSSSSSMDEKVPDDMPRISLNDVAATSPTMKSPTGFRKDAPRPEQRDRGKFAKGVKLSVDTQASERESRIETRPSRYSDDGSTNSDLSSDFVGDFLSSAGMRTLHDKLSSPDRAKKSPADMKRMQEVRQMAAEQNRGRMDIERQNRQLQRRQRAKEVMDKNADSLKQKELHLIQKLQRAKIQHEKYLDSVVSKAGSENNKVLEVSFINRISLEDMKVDLQQRLDAVERRRNERLLEVQAKASGGSRESAAAERRNNAKDTRLGALEQRLAKVESRRLQRLSMMKAKSDYASRKEVVASERRKAIELELETRRQERTDHQNEDRKPFRINGGKDRDSGGKGRTQLKSSVLTERPPSSKKSSSKKKRPKKEVQDLHADISVPVKAENNESEGNGIESQQSSMKAPARLHKGLSVTVESSSPTTSKSGLLSELEVRSAQDKGIKRKVKKMKQRMTTFTKLFRPTFCQAPVPNPRPPAFSVEKAVGALHKGIVGACRHQQFLPATTPPQDVVFASYPFVHQLDNLASLEPMVLAILQLLTNQRDGDNLTETAATAFYECGGLPTVMQLMTQDVLRSAHHNIIGDVLSITILALSSQQSRNCMLVINVLPRLSDMLDYMMQAGHTMEQYLSKSLCILQVMVRHNPPAELLPLMSDLSKYFIHSGLANRLLLQFDVFQSSLEIYPQSMEVVEYGLLFLEALCQCPHKKAVATVTNTKITQKTAENTSTAMHVAKTATVASQPNVQNSEAQNASVESLVSLFETQNGISSIISLLISLLANFSSTPKGSTTPTSAKNGQPGSLSLSGASESGEKRSNTSGVSGSLSTTPTKLSPKSPRKSGGASGLANLSFSVSFRWIVWSTLRILNNVFRLSPAVMQRVLGSTGLQREFHHLVDCLLSRLSAEVECLQTKPCRKGADNVLLYPSYGSQADEVFSKGVSENRRHTGLDSSSPLSYEIMLHELIVLIGHFSLNSPDNQQVLWWSQRSKPNIMLQLSSLPFRYFSTERYSDILFPALIAASFENERNRMMLEQEVNPEMLVQFLQLVSEGAPTQGCDNAEKDASSGSVVPPGHLAVRLPEATPLSERLPPSFLKRALEYFSVVTVEH
jgi:hypothetical protein